MTDYQEWFEREYKEIKDRINPFLPANLHALLLNIKLLEKDTE